MAVEGRRKDFWLWTQRKHVEREYKDDPSRLWDWMKATVPAKYAESFTRQIPFEIENSTKVEHRVLNITYAEPRRLASDVKELAPIDVECEE
jgi:hypothetical protein